jgi:DNA-binding FadR family transcriptional regulator
MAIAVDEAARHDPQRDRALHQHLVDVLAHGTVDEVRQAFDEHLRESAIEVATTLPRKAKRRRRPAASAR